MAPKTEAVPKDNKTKAITKAKRAAKSHKKGSNIIIHLKGFFSFILKIISDIRLINTDNFFNFDIL